MGRYPSEPELKQIREWDWKDCKGLLEFVQSIWEFADCGITVKRNLWHISTGGWSGNEDIIGALSENRMFWALCWQQSRRGGHYIFKVEKIKSGQAS